MAFRKSYQLSWLAVCLYIFSLVLPSLDFTRFHLFGYWTDLTGKDGFGFLTILYQSLISEDMPWMATLAIVYVWIGDVLLWLSPFFNAPRWRSRQRGHIYGQLLGIFSVGAIAMGVIVMMGLLCSGYIFAFLSHAVWFAARWMVFYATYCATQAQEHPSNRDFSRA
jgi:hypothetical protein